ncbi:unnamed protein product [Soboliphyme baturini]|uniref:Ovule protein n=1 Tax=Soboliphyme baturini TaxID=241478 RepID=A0A183ICQ2_9BILA|nr:unnamed protein product [Soboliphyme baturini]
MKSKRDRRSNVCLRHLYLQVQFVEELLTAAECFANLGPSGGLFITESILLCLEVIELSLHEVKYRVSE